MTLMASQICKMAKPNSDKGKEQFQDNLQMQTDMAEAKMGS